MDHHTHTPQEIKDLIIRFLRHETSPREIAVLEEWLEQDPLHRIQFDRINTAYQAFHDQSGYRPVDGAWNLLSGKIEEEPERENVIAMPATSRFHFLKIAASIVFLLMAGLGIWKYSDTITASVLTAPVTAQAGKDKKQLVLPDGTRVWLNAGSTISYEADFGKTDRNVTLQGEAFFDVTKTGIDFIVKTSNLSIQVKGTRFNVTAFTDGRECATLEEGSVALKVNGRDQTFDMKPGDQITFHDGSKEVTHQIVNAPSYSVWKENQIVFENASLAEIVSQIEKRFHVVIKINATIAARENLSMIIRDETLEEVLELIRISSSLQYTIHGNEVTIHE